MRPKLTAMMPVRNEADRYLTEALTDLAAYVDHIVVLDDGSSDNTRELCRTMEKVVLYESAESRFFGRENELRRELLQRALVTRPDWILALDADEIVETRMRHEVADLMDQDEFEAVEFRLFDFWNGRTHYRVDGAWDPWAKRVRALFRVKPGHTYTWPEAGFHCPRVPREVSAALHVYQSDLRIKHFGWASQEDIDRKYERYLAVDDNPHLRSVRDTEERIRLEAWVEGKVLPF